MSRVFQRAGRSGWYLGVSVPMKRKKPLTIVELRDLKIRTEKIEKAIKSRAHISEINQRYNKMKDRNRKNFFKKAS